jgi:hypothetical protein
VGAFFFWHFFLESISSHIPDGTFPFSEYMRQIRFAVFLFLTVPSMWAASPKFVEMTTSMAIDLDGAPNAYGPPDTHPLYNELNAHDKKTGEIAGYLTKSDRRTPVLQGPNDPFPGYYVSTTKFVDKSNPKKSDPRKYVDASKINYVVWGKFAIANGAMPGDFVAVYSKKTGKSVFGIIGDSGNPSGAEGSMALLKALNYPVKNKNSGVDEKEIVIRYFPGSNPQHHFFKIQEQLDQEAAMLGLSKDFPSYK